MKPREFAESMALKMKGILESGQPAMPVAFAHSINDEILVIGFEFPDEASKDIASLVIKLMNQNKAIDYIIFLTDAWIATVKTSNLENVDLSQGVRNIPGRQEAIVASIFTKLMVPEVGYWIYERGEAGGDHSKPVFHEKMKWLGPVDNLEATGRFVPENPRNSKSVQ
jgi:hypothetical protein